MKKKTKKIEVALEILVKRIDIDKIVVFNIYFIFQ